MEILIIRRNVDMHSRIRQIPKIMPISSQIAQKIKSFVATGIMSGRPSKRPVPNHPPEHMPKRPCANWLLISQFPIGSCQSATRFRTWENRKYATTQAALIPASPKSGYLAFLVAT